MSFNPRERKPLWDTARKGQQTMRDYLRFNPRERKPLWDPLCSRCSNCLSICFNPRERKPLWD